MLLKDPKLVVFQLDNFGTFDALGEINEFTSLIWPDSYRGYSTFELYAPITEENNRLLQEGHILWNGGSNAALIEIVYSSLSDLGEKTYIVKGRTLEALLTTRIVWGTYSATSKPISTIMYELVEQNCITPSISNRKIPFLVLSEDAVLGNSRPYQRTGGELYSALQELASEADLGFNIVFDPRQKKLIFKVYQGIDRSKLPQSEMDPLPVILSTELEDILSSSYYKNSQDYKSLVYVAGEDAGESRKRVTAGEVDGFGFLRRELYVDARDLRSEVYLEDGTAITLTEEEYLNTLRNRGLERLSEWTTTETFELQVRASGGQYSYGVDYSKGDKILVRDLELGIQVVGRITEASENYGVNRELVLTFGYAYPSLMRRMKQQLI